MKKPFWNRLGAIVLFSTLGISGTSYAQSSPKTFRPTIDKTWNVVTLTDRAEKDSNNVREKSPKLVSQGLKQSEGYYNEGWASWYGPGFHGNYTANGEIFNQYAMTAAHPYLPFGTLVQVTNLDNGTSVTVRINDRGPYAGGRIIDLSAGAAEAIDMIYSGEAYVALEILN